MAEVQHHGLLFENDIIECITGINKQNYHNLIDGKYISSFDLVKNVGNSKYNYSIKTSGSNTIHCGDILRFYNHCHNDEFIMIIGFWNQKNDLKIYSSIYEIEFKPSLFNKIWGNIEIEELINFVNYVKSIPPGKKARDDNRKIWKEKRNIILSNDANCLMRIDAKIDSKNQRRVQCSFSFDRLLNTGIKYTKYTSNYKGIDIPYEQNSKSRSFSRT